MISVMGQFFEKLLRKNYVIHILVACIVIAHGVLSYASGFNDSPTVDELQHIPAGYINVVKQDFRFNMEKPPIFKQLSALPLTLLDLNFPTSTELWQGGPSKSLEVGNAFFFQSGNDAQTMIRYARFPMVLLSMLLCFYIYLWTAQLTNRYVGLLAAFLYAVSPNFLAHATLANTDVPAALGVFLVLFAGRNFLVSRSTRSAVLFGLACGLGMLFKQSVLLVILIVCGFYVYQEVKMTKAQRAWSKNFFRNGILSAAVGFALMYVSFLFASFSYPSQDAATHVLSFTQDWRIPNSELLSRLSQNVITRPVVLFGIGLVREIIHSESVDTTFLLGDFYRGGNVWYFPTLYLLKTPIYFHILTLVAAVGVAFGFKKLRAHLFSKQRGIDIVIISSTIFLYGSIALNARLNLGIRHVLPIVPLIIILVSCGVWACWKLATRMVLKGLLFFGISLMVVSAVFVSLSEFPAYLSFYNVLSGGTEKGYTVAIDSNFDWGQDYVRLGQWVKDNNVSKLYVDCQPFSDASLQYYLGSSYVRFRGSAAWWNNIDTLSTISELPSGSLVAICASSLKSALYATDGVDGEFIPSYPNFISRNPDYRVGESILIYRVE